MTECLFVSWEMEFESEGTGIEGYSVNGEVLAMLLVGAYS